MDCLRHEWFEFRNRVSEQEGDNVYVFVKECKQKASPDAERREDLAVPEQTVLAMAQRFEGAQPDEQPDWIAERLSLG